MEILLQRTATKKELRLMKWVSNRVVITARSKSRESQVTSHTRVSDALGLKTLEKMLVCAPKTL